MSIPTLTPIKIHSKTNYPFPPPSFSIPTHSVSIFLVEHSTTLEIKKPTTYFTTRKIIYLNFEDTHAPKFFGEVCKVTRTSTILGLIVDNKLNFNEHLKHVEGKVAIQLNVFKRFCCFKWCLKQATLIKLYKTLVLPRLLYAAPVWARKHTQALSRFQYNALKLILGTNTKFNQLAAEILCGLPPMQLQIAIITIKFGIKLSQHQDILWQLYRKCQLPEIRTDKSLIDDFCKVTGATNGYTVSSCHEYLKSR